MKLHLTILASLITACTAELRFAAYGFPNYDCTGPSTDLTATDGKVSGIVLNGIVAIKTAARASMYSDVNCGGQGFVAWANECCFIDRETAIRCLQMHFDG